MNLSVLVLIMILAFSVDRLAKGFLFCLSFIPQWRDRFPDPDLLSNKLEKHRARNRHLIAYTVIVGSIAGAAVWFFPELRLVALLLPEEPHAVVDILVTMLVVMGGSDLVGRIVQISGIGDTGAAAASGETSRRDKPLEIVGKLVVENEDRGLAIIGPKEEGRVA